MSDMRRYSGIVKSQGVKVYDSLDTSEQTFEEWFRGLDWNKIRNATYFFGNITIPKVPIRFFCDLISLMEERDHPFIQGQVVYRIESNYLKSYVFTKDDICFLKKRRRMYFENFQFKTNGWRGFVFTDGKIL